MSVMLYLLVFWFSFGFLAYGFLKGFLTSDDHCSYDWSDELFCWTAVILGFFAFMLVTAVIAFFGRFSFRVLAPRSACKRKDRPS